MESPALETSPLWGGRASSRFAVMPGFRWRCPPVTLSMWCASDQWRTPTHDLKAQQYRGYLRYSSASFLNGRTRTGGTCKSGPIAFSTTRVSLRHSLLPSRSTTAPRGTTHLLCGAAVKQTHGSSVASGQTSASCNAFSLYLHSRAVHA